MSARKIINMSKDKCFALNIRIPYQSRAYAEAIMDILSFELNRDVDSPVNHEFVLKDDAVMVYVRSHEKKYLQPAAETLFKGFYFLSDLLTQFPENGKKYSWTETN